MEQRVKKLEENLLQFSNHLSEMRSDLKYIKENISEYKDIKSTTITHTEQIKTLFNNHADQKKQLDGNSEKINNINLKIALTSGAYGVIIFLINKLI